jgi:glycosidase
MNDSCVFLTMHFTVDRGSEVLDAILDYPSYFELAKTFLDTQQKFSSFASALISSQQKYKHGLFRTGSFVENHDQPRLYSVTKDPGVCHSCCYALLVLIGTTLSLSAMP